VNLTCSFIIIILLCIFQSNSFDNVCFFRLFDCFDNPIFFKLFFSNFKKASQIDVDVRDLC